MIQQSALGSEGATITTEPTIPANTMHGDAHAVDLEKTSVLELKPGKSVEKHAVFRCFSVGTVEVISKFLAELVGTAILLFIGCSTCLTWDSPRSDYIGALGFGLTVMMIIQCFGNVSGAHLNPAVTLCAIIYRTISWPLAIVYVLAQVIGSFVGYGLLALLTPPAIFQPDGSTVGHCMTVPHEGMSVGQALALEFLATMVLIVLCCSSWDPRNAASQDSVALKFGFSVAVLSIAVGPATGCSMNPARTLGPAIWNNQWQAHWIYWVGPMAAAVFTTLLYQGIFAVPTPPKKGDSPVESSS